MINRRITIRFSYGINSANKTNTTFYYWKRARKEKRLLTEVRKLVLLLNLKWQTIFEAEDNSIALHSQLTKAFICIMTLFFTSESQSQYHSCSANRNLYLGQNWGHESHLRNVHTVTRIRYRPRQGKLLTILVVVGLFWVSGLFWYRLLQSHSTIHKLRLTRKSVLSTKDTWNHCTEQNNIALVNCDKMFNFAFF